jgi:hypothetical protein
MLDGDLQLWAHFIVFTAYFMMKITLYCILHGKSNFLSFNLKSLDCNGVIKNCNSEWKMIYFILLG